MTSRNLSSLLVQEIQKHPNDAEFKSKDYLTRLSLLDEYMNTQVHRVQVVGAAIADNIWLNDHGEDHVAMVIHRASQLVAHGKSGECELTPYEAYVLFCAIHFHDVGNYLGRDEHERRVVDAMNKMDDTLLGDNAFEKRMIRDIATAHGGLINGDRDTIGKMKYDRGTGMPRVQLLTALLRFADELADDHTRTSRFLMNHDNPADFFAGSEVYHAYSNRLRSVSIRTNDATVELSFELDEAMLGKLYQKGAEQVHLLDEIFARSLKLHREHVYCSRHMRPWVHIDRVVVHIGVFKNKFMDQVDTLDFTMQENGYPTTPESLDQICPELVGIDGLSFAARIAALAA